MTGSQWYAQAKWEVFKREDVANVYGEDTLIRFVELTDASHLEGAVAYINGQATFVDPVVRGKPVTGTWVTKSVWYEEGRPYGKAGTLRLYHAMSPQGAGTGDGLYVTENGCSYKVTYTFFWRQASLMNPVTASTSGIEYSIKGQSKDPVTGFWDFVLEKREQFTTWTGIVTASDDIFKTVTEQTFLGVRTGDVLAFKAGAEVGTLWTAGNPEKGTLIENVSVSKNDNCTTNVTQRKTVAKAAQGTVERSRTAFGDRQTITLLNQPTAVDAFVAVANGVVTVHAAKPNADGTFDNTETLLTAIPGEYITERSRTAFSESVSITLRNQPTAVDAFVDVTGGIITRRSSKKNDDGTFDNVQQNTVTKQGVTGGRSSVDAFSSVTAVEDVAAEALGAAPEPADGVTVEHKDDLDEDGLWRRVKTTETSREVDDAVTDTAADAAETVTESESRGKAAPLSAPEDPEGTVSRVTNTKSKDGRWTQRLRQTVAKLWAAHTMRRVRDAFGSEVETRSDGVATADLPGGPAAADRGVWNELLLQQRKDRKWDVRAVAHTEDDVAVAESVAEENPLESVTETESVGASQAAAPASAAGYISRSVSSLTRGGKWKRRTVERREKAYALPFAARETFEETVTAEAGQAGAVALDAAGGGTYRTASASLTAGGLLRYTIQRITEKIWSKTYKSSDDYFSTTEQERGVADSLTVSAATGTAVQASADVTPGGLLRYTIQRIAEKLWTKTYTVGEDYFTTTEQERGVAGSLTVSAATGTAVQASADVTAGGLLRYSKNTETAKAAQSWTLLDQTTSNMRGNAFERTRVKLYSNSELETAKADVAAFVAASVEFVDVRGATAYHYYWEHDIAFGLHVNKLGKWDGTVTIRAHAVLGWAQTQTS